MCLTRLPFADMYILYLDDSGSVGDADDRHVILAGAAVFERTGHWLSEQMDGQARILRPEDPGGLEFHGAEMHGGGKRWRKIAKEDRIAAYTKALSNLTKANQVRLFAAVVHKDAIGAEDAMELAFEHVVNRFDRMLGRFFRARNTQRGIIVLDESSYETSLQSLAVNFKAKGHRWGRLYNLAEVPLFVNFKATRLIQYADLVAHACRRYYNAGDSTYFDVIRAAFDSQGGVIHGLIHQIPDGMDCPCPTCRRKPRKEFHDGEQMA